MVAVNFILSWGIVLVTTKSNEAVECALIANPAFIEPDTTLEILVVEDIDAEVKGKEFIPLITK